MWKEYREKHSGNPNNSQTALVYGLPSDYLKVQRVINAFN